MLTSKDLMIGDWVRTEAGALIVAGVGHKIYCRANDGNPTHLWEVTSIDPIPLTPEILEKNGFIIKHPESAKRTYWKDRAGQIVGHKNRGLMYMEISGNPVKFGYFIPHFSGHIQFVHEFQRALRCVGLFELANNFKI